MFTARYGLGLRVYFKFNLVSECLTDRYCPRCQCRSNVQLNVVRVGRDMKIIHNLNRKKVERKDSPTNVTYTSVGVAMNIVFLEKLFLKLRNELIFIRIGPRRALFWARLGTVVRLTCVFILQVHVTAHH